MHGPQARPLAARAPEGRQNVAHGASRGLAARACVISPVGATEAWNVRFCRPYGAGSWVAGASRGWRRGLHAFAPQGLDAECGMTGCGPSRGGERTLNTDHEGRTL